MDVENIDEHVYQSSRRVMAAHTKYDWMAAVKRSALCNTTATIGLETCDVEEHQPRWLAALSRHSEDSSYSGGSASDADEMSEYSSSHCNGKKTRALRCVGFVLIAAAVVGVSVRLAIRGPNKDGSETTSSSTVGPERPLEQSFEDIDDEGYSP